MQQLLVKDAREILSLMEEVELAVAGLYRSCAGKFPEDGNFWQQLEQEELQHADYVRRMTDVVARGPEHFRINPQFNALAVRAFIQGVNDSRHKVETGGIGARQALFLARDIEEIYIERNFFDSIYGDDPDFLSLFRQIVVETTSHRQLLKERIDALQDTAIGREGATLRQKKR
jgi:rubrerythrin